MPAIHVRDELYGRYVKATGDMAFNTFVNDVVEAAVKRVEKERRGKDE